MKISTLLGITAIAGYVAHRNRGGTMTLDSIKDSFRALGDTLSNGMQKLKTTQPPMPRNGVRSATDADIMEPAPGAPFKDVH